MGVVLSSSLFGAPVSKSSAYVGASTGATQEEHLHRTFFPLQFGISLSICGACLICLGTDFSGPAPSLTVKSNLTRVSSIMDKLKGSFTQAESAKLLHHTFRTAALSSWTCLPYISTPFRGTVKLPNMSRILYGF